MTELIIIEERPHFGDGAEEMFCHGRYAEAGVMDEDDSVISLEALECFVFASFSLFYEGGDRGRVIDQENVIFAICF